MASYQTFARFYDAVQGDRAEHAAYLRGLIERFRPDAQTVLELACGSGSILKQLGPHYVVTGVDLSERMLALASKKVPEVRLIRADMRQINLDERFDVVLCVYDSINHLLDFAQWEDVFERVREHLDEGGLFVFDVNTERRLAALIEQPPLARWLGERDLLVLNVSGGGDGVSVWEIRVFEHIADSDYRLHAEDIREASFPASQIRASLRERFARVSTYDARRSRPTSRSERLHFVCQA